jgi:DNA-binding XRE family transcriptional regulator
MKEEPKHRLQKARADAGFKSPAEAARAIREINQHTLTSHENGNRPISKKAAEQYARLFGVRAGWLLFGEESEDSPKTPLDRLRDVLARAAGKPAEIQERIIDFAEFEMDRYEKSRETAT